MLSLDDDSVGHAMTLPQDDSNLDEPAIESLLTISESTPVDCSMHDIDLSVYGVVYLKFLNA